MRDDRPHYTFGDTPLAAQRLELLSDVLEPSTRAFLAASAPTAPAVALDLGCGPGTSTRLLAQATRARRVIGVDTSEPFVALAASQATPTMTFIQHDATAAPLPGAPADLIYCRLLLAHVADPAATVRAWATQLAPRGRLLVEEMEWIHARHPVLERYEAVVLDLVASRGAPMYAGPLVATVPGGRSWRRVANDVRTVPVAVSTAARIYDMNLTTWREDPHIRAHYPAGPLDDLARDLAALARSASTQQIAWGVRQVVDERDAP